MGLGIKYVGVETAELLADHFDLDQLLHIKEEDLLPSRALAKRRRLPSPNIFAIGKSGRDQTAAAPWRRAEAGEKKSITGHAFSGKTFVLTGSLENYSRDEAARLIKERGGHVTETVTKKTDYVVVGREPGSKYEKAQKLNIQILSEEQFRRMLES